jgi:G:T/U-mismatch repair DNA glycosylase
MKSIHPYEPFIPEGSTRLIIGTIPPHRFCDKTYESLAKDDVDFNYGSRDNYFWELMGKVFKVDFKYENTKEAVQQRKDFLAQHKIGITDIISECERKDGSSEDNKLTEFIYKDLEELLRNNLSIETLFYTSKEVKSLVYKALNKEHRNTSNDGQHTTIEINGKVYQVKILFSPSPSALRGLGENGEAKRLQQYTDFFNA